MKKKWMCLCMAVLLGFSLCACQSSDVTDQITNVVQSEDPHVLGVKEASPAAYPDQTYGEAFERFFKSPAWKYFVGTKEGPDEDGDGEPDYEEDGIDVVEFTGYCLYQDVEVKARIQFTLSEDGETFTATYLSFNEVPQSMLILGALLEKVFENGVTEPADEPESTASSSESAASKQERSSSGIVGEDPLLEEFIELICSYSDPPELPEEEVQKYFQGEFELWKKGEGYTFIAMDENGHLVIPDHSASFVGEWWDEYSQRCYMDISCSDGMYYTIEINWSDSAWENSHWYYDGFYDETLGGIYCYGSLIQETYTEDGEMEETCIYSDGEALLWLGDDGYLYWDDHIQQQGAECFFTRA